MNILLTKSCFLKLEIDTSLELNLLKAASSFQYRQARLKSLFSSLLKLIFKKINVPVILQVEFARLTCVNILMSLFIIPSSLYTCL